MLVPICLLALGALLAGQIFHGIFIDPERAAEYWRGSIAFGRAPRRKLRTSSRAVGQALPDHRRCWSACGSPGTTTSAIRAPRPLRRDLPRHLPVRVQQMVFRRALRRDLCAPTMWLGRLFWHAVTKARSTASARMARPMPSASATGSPTGSSRAISIPTRW